MRDVIKKINVHRLRLQKQASGNDFYLAIIAVILMITLTILIGTINNRVVPLYPKLHFHYTAEPSNPLKILSNWDGPDYLNIAKFNYRVLFDTSFFPFYPALIYFLSFIFRSPLITALLISWLSLVGALFFYIKILRELGWINKTTDAIKAMVIFLLFPSAIFLLATYTESLFSFMSLGAIYFALLKKWKLSALLLVLIGATHVTGLLVIGLVFLLLLEEGVGFLRAASAAVSGLIGIFIFAAFLKSKFNDPLEFIKSQTQIHGWVHHGFTYLWSTTGAFNLLSIGLVVAAAIYFWHIKKSFSIYTLSFLIIPLIGGQYGGFNRYILTAYPIEFMLYALLKRRKEAMPYVLALSAILWTLVALEYLGGYVGS